MNKLRDVGASLRAPFGRRLFAAVAGLAFALAFGAAQAVALNLSQAPAASSFKSIAPNLIMMLDDSGSMQWEWLGNQGYIDSFTYGFPLGSSQPYGTRIYQDYIPGFEAKNIYAAQFRNGYVNPNYYNPAINYTPWACPAAYPESSSNAPSYTPTVGGSCQWNADLGLWLWPNADPSKAYLGPEHPAAGWRALNVWNDSTDATNSTSGNGYIGNTSGTNSLRWVVYNPGTGSGSGAYYSWAGPYPYGFSNGNSNSVYAYGFWPATYFTYDGPRSGPSQNTAVNGIGYYDRIQICPQATQSVSTTAPAGGTATVTACTQPPNIQTNNISLSSNDYYHTYTASPDTTFLAPNGTSYSCPDVNENCYVYVKDDGSLVVRTYTQEMQNFANWYQYYRSHVLMAQAATSQAFMSLPEGFRVDYSLLNHMAGGGTPQYAVTEDFGTTQRGDFLQHLFQTAIPAQGTPSRKALHYIGDWLSQAPSSAAPWGASTAENQATGQSYLSCRQNYLLFVTDGGWNGGFNTPEFPSTAGTLGSDSTSGPTNTGPNNQSYTYSPAPPYNNYDNSSRGYYSLANVAMDFWKNDLQTGSGMQNDVPTNSADPAFWQHLTTFAVGLGIVPDAVYNYMLSNPGVSVDTAQAAVYSDLSAPAGSNNALQWTTDSCWVYNSCSGNEGAQVEDLWHAGVDGHGGFFSAKDPTALATAIKDTLINIINRVASSSSVAVNTQKGQEVKTETQVYQPLFHPQNWWGELLAEPITINATTGQPEISTTPAWNASCVLTGTAPGTACPTAGNSAFTDPSAGNSQHPGRQILSWNGSKGVPFEWSNNATANTLSSTQLTALGSSSVVDFLRGVRTDEVSSGGTLRARTSVLGDIVDSSPKWVGFPNIAYPTTSGQPTSWQDSLYPTASMPENSAAKSYQQFATDNESRTNVVYVGANDGFLHAFRAGHYTLNNGQLTYDSTDNDGKELLAYMPETVVGIAKQYSDTNYDHHFFVDATPYAGDLYYAGAWHTWLVGGDGGGGQDLYALDITDPSSFSESNAATIVKANWTPTSLNAYSTCYVNGSASSSCGNYLGYTYGSPLIRRFHNGDWGVIWGNGLNSTNGTAGIYVGLIDHTTGSWKIYYLGTGYGAAQDPTGASRSDGIMYPTSADLDGDHVTDYIYAGDYFGNVWRFNVTSSNPADWHASKYGNAAATPLFSAKNANGTAQPITTKVNLVAIPDASTGHDRLLVEFGTGSSVLDTDSAPDTTNAGVQSLYGIWDWDMGQWNSGYTTANGVTVPAASVLYDALSAPQSISSDRSTLQQQTITDELDDNGNTYAGNGTGHRLVSDTQVCWKGSTASCTTGTANAYGWYLDLVSPRTNVGNNGQQGEKVIYNPTVENGVFIVNTTILTGSAGLTCNPVANAGWTMALDPANGGRLGFEAFYNAAGQLVTIPGVSNPTSGITLGAVGTPSFVVYNGQKYMVVSTASGQTKLLPVNLGGGITSGRLSWVELR